MHCMATTHERHTSHTHNGHTLCGECRKAECKSLISQDVVDDPQGWQVLLANFMSSP